MKLNILETHDRLQHFKKHDFNIAECCQDLINQRPFGDHAFYIFAHARTDDDGVTKRMIWQPRLTKPKAQSNSILFKAYPGTDNIKIIWMIPAEELWGQYQKGLMTESQIVTESIYNFQNHKAKLEAKEADDLEDFQINDIYRQIALSSKSKKLGLIL
jgi:hypothetical protein